MQSIRIIEFPDCKMVSSGIGMFGQEKFDKFNEWFSALPPTMYPMDFLAWDGGEFGKEGGFHWLFKHEENKPIPPGYDIIDFKGGLYAVSTDVDKKTDVDTMNKTVDEFLEANGLERDKSRLDLGHIITSQLAGRILGYDQMDYYTPIKQKRE